MSYVCILLLPISALVVINFSWILVLMKDVLKEDGRGNFKVNYGAL